MFNVVNVRVHERRPRRMLPVDRSRPKKPHKSPLRTFFGNPLKLALRYSTHMHHVFELDEILRTVANELIASYRTDAALSFACSCKSFSIPVLDTMWEEEQRDFMTLLKTLPPSVWVVASQTFVSPIPLDSPSNTIRQPCLSGLSTSALGGGMGPVLDLRRENAQPVYQIALYRISI